MKNLLLRLYWLDDGQDLIEYGLLAALISIVAVLAVTNVGTALQTYYTGVETAIP